MLIATRRLDLIAASKDALLADLESRAALARALGVVVPLSWPPELYDADAVHWMLSWMDAHPSEHRWGFYYMTLRETDGTRTLIGASGHKGAPSDGAVEIGYGVLPEYRRRGFATEATNGLVAAAFADEGVNEVVAHTLPHLTPSIGVLERAGFTFAGPGSDPTEPTAIRYVLKRADFRKLRRVAD
jgi:ribosomal-protein-alanine N-acetyltransferase